MGDIEWDTPAVMPGFAARQDISDEDLAAVATYIRNSWGNAEDSGGAFKDSTLGAVREATESRSNPYTEEDFQSPEQDR